MASLDDDPRERPTEVSPQDLNARREAPTARVGGSGAIPVEQVGTLLLDNYLIEEKLPKGGEGIVYRCKDRKRNAVVAVKFYPAHIARPSEEVLSRLKKEIRDHPDLAKLIHYEKTSDGLFEVMEYAEGGSLAGVVLKHQELRGIFAEVHNAIRRLHQSGIIHRDIKPGNLLFRKKNRKDLILADFGLSSIMSSEYPMRMTDRMGGTPLFMAPEMILSRSATDVVTPKGDYFALGMTILVLLTGPDLDTLAPGRLNYLKAQWELPIPGDLPAEWQTLLKGLLFPIPDRRWGGEQVDDWLKGKEVALPIFEDDFYYKFAPYEEARSPEELAKLMRRDPDRARRQLASGAMFSGLSQRRPDLAAEIDSYVKRFARPDIQLTAVLFALDPAFPYQLAPGLEATDRKAMARLIDASDAARDAAKEQLFDGRLPAWLLATGHEAAANEWFAKVEPYRQAKAEREGLEYFLHVLDPDLALPGLKVESDDLGHLVMRPDRDGEFRLAIANPGRGYLSGVLSLSEPDHGFQIQPRAFSGPRTDVVIRASYTSLTVGPTYETTLNVSSNSSTPKLSRSVKVLVRFSTMEAWMIGTGWAVACAAAAGAILAGLRAIIGWIVNDQEVWVVDQPDDIRFMLLGGLFSAAAIGGAIWRFYPRKKK